MTTQDIDIEEATAVKGNYNAEQIHVLEGLEAVRKRPAMYIGSTSSRGHNRHKPATTGDLN